MCKHLTALNLRNEAEGTRTLNLRIDSLLGGFVSVFCKKTNDCGLTTYDAGRSAAEAA